MARFSPFRRIARAVENLFRREPTPTEPPKQPPPGPDYFPPGAPRYDASTNTWTGISKADWRAMQRLMDEQIRSGANYNETLTKHTWASEDERRELKPRDRQRLYIDAYPPAQRYGYIIDVLEGRLVTPEDMLAHLKESAEVAREYARGNKDAGRRRWENRNHE